MQDDLPERPAFLPPGFGTVGHEEFVEIVAPAPVSYQPQTSGWYVLLAVLIGAVVWGTYRAISHYRRNVYRRVALKELSSLREGAKADRRRALSQLPAFLKRCALVAFPRRQVAALSGESWLSFLEETAPGVWSSGAKEALQVLVVSEPDKLAQEREAALFDAVDAWIRKHRVVAVDPGAQRSPGARRV